MNLTTVPIPSLQAERLRSLALARDVDVASLLSEVVDAAFRGFRRATDDRVRRGRDADTDTLSLFGGPDVPTNADGLVALATALNRASTRGGVSTDREHGFEVAWTGETVRVDFAGRRTSCTPAEAREVAYALLG